VKRTLVNIITELWFPLVVLTALWVLSEKSTSFYFPPLRIVLETFRRLWLFSQVRSDVLPSLGSLGLGYCLAAGVGIVLGIILGLLPRVHSVISPIMEFLRAIPGVMLLPLMLLLVGISATLKISVIAYAASWPILLNTIDGVRGLDPGLLDVARSYRLPWMRRLIWVILPAAAPQILSGMRTSLSLGVTVILFSELVGSINGIGHRMLEYQRSFAMPETWSCILLMGILGYGLNGGFLALERRVLKWDYLRRRQSIRA